MTLELSEHKTMEGSRCENCSYGTYRYDRKIISNISATVAVFYKCWQCGHETVEMPVVQQ